MSGKKQNNIFTTCPSCHAAYKVPDIAMGKEVTCKQCNTLFKVTKFIPDGQYPLLGKIAVENRLINEKDLVEALSTLGAEKSTGKKITLEQILLEKKLITQEVLENLIITTTRQLDKEFGVLAIKKNLISKNDVNEALKAQAQHFKKNRTCIPIGNILTHKGLLSEEKCNDILKLQQRLEKKTDVMNLKSGKPLKGEKPRETEVRKDEMREIPERDIAEAGSKVEVYKDKKFFQIRQMDKEFVQLAVDSGFISKEEGENALKEQLCRFEDSKIQRTVGDILVDTKLLSKKNRDSILLKQKRINKKDCEDSENDEYIINTEVKINKMNFQLMVKRDGLSAYLIRHEDLPEPFTVSDIKDFLVEQKIAYGIVDDSLIQGFLQHQGQKNKQFKIAEGKPVKKGRDGSIEYYFETEHLKVGAVQKGGKIDFKDRGEIPHVSKGDLLAEMVPMIKGEQGIDIYACPIPIPEIKDLSLRGGTGVEFSEDGLKLYSKVDGQPDASFGGKISVLQELNIPGDVGFETGHVEFDGNVNVSGTIQSGFRVRAANLSAHEIMAADIETTGDIEISGGIIDSTIKTQGGVKGKYFKNATISAFGDIRAQKEIIDSTIETSGATIVQNGKIISSEITAKNGIESRQIGTDISVPCKLTVGVGVHGENELKALNKTISTLMESKEELLKKEEASKATEHQSHIDIADLAQVQDRAMVEQRSLEAGLVEMKEKGEKKAVADTEALIKELDQKARTADDEISALFEKQDKLSEEQAEVLNQTKKIDEQIQELQEEKEAILNWSKKEKGNAYVKVYDLIYEGTVVKGGHTTMLILKKSRKNCQIREIRVDSTGDESDWEMKIII